MENEKELEEYAQNVADENIKMGFYPSENDFLYNHEAVKEAVISGYNYHKEQQERECIEFAEWIRTKGGLANQQPYQYEGKDITVNKLYQLFKQLKSK